MWSMSHFHHKYGGKPLKEQISKPHPNPRILWRGSMTLQKQNQAKKNLLRWMFCTLNILEPWDYIHDSISGQGISASHTYGMYSWMQTPAETNFLLASAKGKLICRIGKTIAFRHLILPFPLLPSIKQKGSFSGTESLTSFDCKQ